MNYATEYNSDNPAAHLLSKDRIKQMLYGLQQWKVEKQDLEDKVWTWSKYGDRLWFHRLLRKTRSEFYEEQRRASIIINSLQEDIDLYERLLFLHDTALEALTNDLVALSKVNLSQVELIQASMF